MDTKILEPPRSKGRGKRSEPEATPRNPREKPDVRDLRGKSGIRSDYDYKALRIETA